MKILNSVILMFVLAVIGNAQTVVLSTPQAAAKAVYEAWRTKNRAAARTAAETKAIDKLFSTNFIPKRKFDGCTDESETEKGLYQCFYKHPDDDLLNVAFEVVKKGKSWRVRWVTFAAEN